MSFPHTEDVVGQMFAGAQAAGDLLRQYARLGATQEANVEGQRARADEAEARCAALLLERDALAQSLQEASVNLDAARANLAAAEAAAKIRADAEARAGVEDMVRRMVADALAKAPKKE